MVKKLVKREIALILDSDENSGALQKSADGSTFSVQFDQPILIPKNAINPTLDVEESAVWFSTPNIFDGSTGEISNNTFRVIMTDDMENQLVVYETTDFLIQRWNHVVINYYGNYF